MQKPSRPTGVTVLAILCILAAIAGLFSGAILIGVGLVIGTYAGSQLTDALATSGYSGLASLGAGTIGAVLTVIGAIVLILGVLYFAVGVGFLRGKGWSWTLGMIVSIIYIVIDIVQIVSGAYSSAFGLIIGIIIVYYVTRPHVKAFFGKGAAMPSAPASPPATM